MNKFRYYGLWTMAYLGASFGFLSYVKINGYSPFFGFIGSFFLIALYSWGCRFDEYKNG